MRWCDFTHLAARLPLPLPPLLNSSDPDFDYLLQGASPAQARAALKQYKDVMQAAERIFDGQFDDVAEEPGGDASPAQDSRRSVMMAVSEVRVYVLASSAMTCIG